MEPSAVPLARSLDAAAQGDSQAAAQLLPLVYEELRSLARARLARESPGHTLQPTALVHEAYLRVMGNADPGWNGRGHFFGAAALAMRRILVEHARRKAARGAGAVIPIDEIDQVAVIAEPPDVDVVALDEALDELARTEPLGSQIVTVRYFAGLTVDAAAEVLGMSKRTVEREWHYALAKLLQLLTGNYAQGLPACP